MRKFTRVLIGLLLILPVLNVFSAQAQDKTPTVAVKIGVMGPFTGPAASIGQEQLNWAKLAVEDFNKASGWKVELVEGDTQLDPAQAVTVATSLIANKDIYGTVGPAGSQEVEATSKAFKDARLVQISPSATRPSLIPRRSDGRRAGADGCQFPCEAVEGGQAVHHRRPDLVLHRAGRCD
jgi:branched-chain amino acid transport system substrate-binding protein